MSINEAFNYLYDTLRRIEELSDPPDESLYEEVFKLIHEECTEALVTIYPNGKMK